MKILHLQYALVGTKNKGKILPALYFYTPHPLTRQPGDARHPVQKSRSPDKD
jgi:hypothetical protein